MAYSNCNHSSLRNAIMRVWRPTVGAKSFIELVDGNAEKIFHSYGHGAFARAMFRDNLPFRPSFPSIETFSDNQPPFEFDKVLLSGSWAEGLAFYGYAKLKVPDMDFMLVLKNISFSERDQQSAGKLALKEDTPFVDAYITDEKFIEMWKDFFIDENYCAEGRRLSSYKLKEKLHQNHRKQILQASGIDNSIDVDDGASVYINRFPYHSPALNAMKLISNISSDSHTFQDIGEIVNLMHECREFTGWDVVLAISCDGWPSCARDWATRNRIWPQDDLVKKITHDGFHIVPKSSAEGDFRLSFSCAETCLIENLTEIQHKVLRSLKAVVKFHQNTWSPNIKEIITTYHLKTIAFWHFEKTMQDSFTEESVDTHLILLLQELANSLRIRELPLYFLPKVNLFKNVDPEEAVDIAEKIEHLSRDIPGLIESLENITLGFSKFSSLTREIIGKFNDTSCKLQKKRKEREARDPSTVTERDNDDNGMSRDFAQFANSLNWLWKLVD